MKHSSFHTIIQLTLFLAICLPHAANSQVVWMRQGGISGIGNGISVDAAANCYVAGQVGSPALFDLDTTASNFADAFIAKYDGSGIIQWVRTGGNVLVDQANDIATDANGNSYITGFFRTNAPYPTVTFSNTVLTGLGSSDLFLAKYDPSGTLLWIRHVGGSAADEGRGVALSPDGNIVVSGSFQDSVTLGSDTLVSDGLSDVLILKYDPQGNLLWSTRAGGPGDDGAHKLTVLPNGDIAVVGNFQQQAVFGSITLNSTGLHNIFLARYDGSGTCLWAVRAGTTISFASDEAYDVAHDTNGDIVFSGNVPGVADFDGISIVPNGDGDIFIARYTGNGNAIWVHHAGGPHADHGYGLALDAEGNSYLTGQVDDGATTVFDSITIPPFANESVFLAKYDVNGSIQWVRRYAPGLGRAIAVVDESCLVFTGGASGIVGNPAFDAVPWQYVDRAIFTARFCMDPTTRINAVRSIQDAFIYPNPTANELNVRIPQRMTGPVKLQLRDMAGRCVGVWNTTADLVRIDLSSFAESTYQLIIENGTARTVRAVSVVH